MLFDTSTRLYSMLAERINVPICNKKGLTQFVSNLCFSYGAGDENRTHNHSLGSCCFATKLHLHRTCILYAEKVRVVNCF